MIIRGSRPGRPDRNGLPELTKPYVYRGRKRGVTAEEERADRAAQRWAEDVASGRLKPPAEHSKCSGCGYKLGSVNHRVLCRPVSRETPKV